MVLPKSIIIIIKQGNIISGPELLLQTLFSIFWNNDASTEIIFLIHFVVIVQFASKFASVRPLFSLFGVWNYNLSAASQRKEKEKLKKAV